MLAIIMVAAVAIAFGIFVIAWLDDRKVRRGLSSGVNAKRVRAI